MMATPFFFSRSTISKSLVISRLVREEVGSSIITSLTSLDRALTTSTICIWAMLSFLTRVLGFMSNPRLSISSLLSRIIFL